MSAQVHSRRPSAFVTGTQIASTATGQKPRMSERASETLCSGSPTPSLYVTLKVLQFVDAFRKRATRARAARRSRPARSPATCSQKNNNKNNKPSRPFGNAALAQVHRYLERKNTTQSHRRYAQQGRIPAPWRLPHEARGEDEDDERATPLSKGSLRRILGVLDGTVTCNRRSLAAYATSNRLFVRRHANFTVACDKSSIDILSELLLVVRELLRMLRQPRGLVNEPSKVNGEVELDVWSANAEHLLLCLDTQLLGLLVRVLAIVLKTLGNWQRSKGMRRRNGIFFFEFPDARHPLSTTWPWSIRPALAVLWGVCWMFYATTDQIAEWDLDEQENLVDRHGSVLASREELERDISHFTRTAPTAQRTSQPRRAVSELQAASMPMSVSVSASTSMSAPVDMALSPGSAVSSGSHSARGSPLAWQSWAAASGLQLSPQALIGVSVGAPAPVPASAVEARPEAAPHSIQASAISPPEHDNNNALLHPLRPHRLFIRTCFPPRGRRVSPLSSPSTPAYASASTASPFQVQVDAAELRHNVSPTIVTAAAQPPSSYAPPRGRLDGDWLAETVVPRAVPQEASDASLLFGRASDSAVATHFHLQPAQVGAWQPSLPEPHNTSFALPSDLPPPRLTRDEPTPTIRVFTDPAAFPTTAQQQDASIPDAYHSAAASVSSGSSAHPFQEPAQPYYTTPITTNITTASLSPHTQQFMSADRREMQTPPRSPYDQQQQQHHHHNYQQQQHQQHQQQQQQQQHNQYVEAAVVPPTRKRSHSAMSAEHVPDDMNHLQHDHHRSPSMQSINDTRSPQGEGFSPRTRTIKRDDPPVNQEGKYFCNYAPECEGQIFDRKCEWSKHMDKHVRPYRCPHPSCAKLQGFTYSGGLLRHEREVHGKHGGPKAQLMCPVPNCKRQTGKGFTRKENLNEHLRRVHNNRIQTTPNISLRPDGSEALPGADNIETPVSRISEALTSDSVISPALKRRRTLTGMEDSGLEEVDQLREEVMRLRAENAEKDARLAHMEQKMDEVAQRREEDTAQMRLLHDELRQMQMQQANLAT